MKDQVIIVDGFGEGKDAEASKRAVMKVLEAWLRAVEREKEREEERE